MNSDGSPLPDGVAGFDPLWDALARDHRDMSAVGPVLRHLVMGETTALFGEEPVARTRGMVESLAIALLRLSGDPADRGRRDALVGALIDVPSLLKHVHAQALEGQIVGRLAEQGHDPLLPPLVQDRISSPDPAIAGLAMNLMAAQTRFVRRQQRMELAPAELPGDVLHDCLACALGVVGREGRAGLEAMRAEFDERRGRLAIMAQLGLGLGDDFAAALDPARAGFSLFATALSLMTGHERDTVVLAASHDRPVRLALLLATAGLHPVARESVLVTLQPDAELDGEWLSLDSQQAADLLAQGRPR